MNILNTMTSNAWDSLGNSFNLLWSKISPILLPLAFVLIFLGIGLWVAGFVGDKVGAIVKKSKIDNLLDRILEPALKITGTKINPTAVIAGSIKWFLIALVLIAALDLADLHGVISFVNQIIGYLPNVFVAALILIAGSMLANLAGTIVGFVSHSGFPTTAKGAVNALALIAAFSQLVTPIVGSFSNFVSGLSLSNLQADVLVIGIIVLALLASKGVVTRTVENFYKH